MSKPQLTTKEQERLKVIQALLKGEMVNTQAATMLKLSLRQVKRLRKKVKEQGEDAVVHSLKGKVGNHHIPKSTKHKVIKLVREKYADFGPTFASEKLMEVEDIAVHPQTLRRWMDEAGLWRIKKQRKVEYHAWRERKEYFGELQQFDGSYHLWFEGRLLDELGNPQEVCLLASIDDATGQITQAKFDFNEGVVPVFNFWKEYVKTLGKPLGIYLDKFYTYKINHKIAVDNHELMSQFQTAMKLLDIQVINANPPQSKGRIERLFQTLQDRLVKELRLANISTIAEGNKLLSTSFIHKFNDQFSVTAIKAGDVHRALTQAERLKTNSIFSIKHLRRVNSDFTIQFKEYFYQLEQIQPVTIRPKEKVLVEKWLDNTLHLKFKGKYLKYFVLPQKPQKVSKQPAILTNHPLNWKPPPNHPWRQHKNKILP